MAHLRPISNLFNFDKCFETLVTELIIDDMKAKFNPSQYANQKKTSVQHYLINLVHRILTSLDNNSRGETFAALAVMIDWRQAFSRQDHKLGVESFIKEWSENVSHPSPYKLLPRTENACKMARKVFENS